jgi:hypothetical protein
MTSPSTPFNKERKPEEEAEALRKAIRLERIKQRTLELGLYTEYWDSSDSDPDNDTTKPAA